jgi:ATP-dependent Clp protease ATP-binding subunit ClpC
MAVVVAIWGFISLTRFRTENLSRRLALEESRALGHSYIGTEHILLGLIHEGDGVAAQVLTGLGADLNGAREQVIRILDEHRREHGHETG